jgi:hypothetical protein
MKLYGAAFFLSGVVAQNSQGPGKGPWEVVTPESQGLSHAALDEAAEKTFQGLNKN